MALHIDSISREAIAAIAQGIGGISIDGRRVIPSLLRLDSTLDQIVDSQRRTEATVVLIERHLARLIP